MRLFRLGDNPRSHRGEDHPVREEVLDEESHRNDCKDEKGSDPQRGKEPDEEKVDRRKQKNRDDHPHLEPAIPMPPYHRAITLENPVSIEWRTPVRQWGDPSYHPGTITGEQGR